MLKREQLQYAENRIREIERQKHDAIIQDCTTWVKAARMTSVQFAKAVKTGKIKARKDSVKLFINERSSVESIWDLTNVVLVDRKKFDSRAAEKRQKALSETVRNLHDQLYLGDAAGVLLALDDLAKQKF